jgi:acetyltransferase
MSYETRRRPINGRLDFFLAPRSILALGDVELRSTKVPVLRQGHAELAVISNDLAQNLSYALEQGVAAALLLGNEAVSETLLAQAEAAHVAILGPDSLGLIVPAAGLHLSLSQTPVLPGRVAFVTQSGALGAAILDWAEAQRVGFSAFLSLGKGSDIGFGECIDYLAQDYQTQSILLYVETIADARRFLSAAREAALHKPVIVLKSGREDAQREAAFDAAFRRCGALRVYRIAELFSLAEVLSRQPRPRGPRLAILSNGNGPARLAADALRSAGGQLASVRDLGGAAGPTDFASALGELAADPGCDGILAVLSPLPAAEPEATAQALLAAAAKCRKTLLTSWMGGALVAGGRELLNEARLPVFPYPDTAARAFVALSVYSSSLQALYETPIFAGEFPDAASCGPWLGALREGGVQTLDAGQLERLFAAYGLDWRPAGKPMFSLQCEADATFGPLLTLGAGEDAQRVYGDFTAALPPLTSTLARRMIERLRAHLVLDEAAVESLALLLVRFSRLVSELPILAKAKLRLSVPAAAICSAEIALQPLALPEAEWPRCVVRPYPSQYVQEIRLRDGATALLRPIRPEDETLIVDFHSDLSERSVYLRYLQFLQLEERILHDRLARVCFNDYDRELALVVEQAGRILGVGRMQRNPLRSEPEAEVAFLVRDSAQGQGVGGALLRHIVEVARAEAVQELTAELLASNTPMRLLLERAGFAMRLSGDGSTLLARLRLKDGKRDPSGGSGAAR